MKSRQFTAGGDEWRLNKAAYRDEISAISMTKTRVAAISAASINAILAKPGHPLRMAMSAAGKTNTLLGWGIVAVLLAWILGIFQVGRGGNIALALAGAAPLVALFCYFVRRGKQYYKAHPEGAAQAARQHALLRETVDRRANRTFKQKMILVGIGIAVVLLLDSARHFESALSQLSSGEQFLYLALGAVTLVVLGNFAWTAWKKRRGA